MASNITLDTTIALTPSIHSISRNTSNEILLYNDHEIHKIQSHNNICNMDSTPNIKYETDCIMCMESADPRLKPTCDIAHLSCGHIYHYNCLMEWQQTIQHYFLSNIECCICKQSVYLTGIWHSNGIYKPITHNYDLKHLHDPLLSITHRNYSPNPNTHITDINGYTTSNNNPRPRRKLMSYIPGLSCCFSIS